MRTQTPFGALTQMLTGMTVLSGLASPAPTLAQEPQIQRHAYTLVDLGTLGGTETIGYVINDRGEVTGYSYLPGDASFHAFRSNGTVMQDLGTLGGQNSQGLSINNRGQITGSAETAAEAAEHAFLSTAGRALLDLGTLGGTDSEGSAINDAGQITGQASTSGDRATHAFLYNFGTMIDLGTPRGNYSWGAAINLSAQVAGNYFLPGGGFIRHAATSFGGGPLLDIGTLGGPDSDTLAVAINLLGHIAGYSVTNGGNTHAFLYRFGVMMDLGALGDMDSYAAAVNNRDQVTGESQPPNTSGEVLHAFLYTRGAMEDLGTLASGDSSYATAINDLGEVTGWDANDFGTAAFVYSNGKMTNLNALLSPRDAQLYTLIQGAAINDRGQILVYGIVNNSTSQGIHTFILTCGNSRSFPVQPGNWSRCGQLTPGG
jgi:probable HAF family extracellular repeat protein